jgi:hypothetical protein
MISPYRTTSSKSPPKKDHRVDLWEQHVFPRVALVLMAINMWIWWPR